MTGTAGCDVAYCCCNSASCVSLRYPLQFPWLCLLSLRGLFCKPVAFDAAPITALDVPPLAAADALPIPVPEVLDGCPVAASVSVGRLVRYFRTRSSTTSTICSLQPIAASASSSVNTSSCRCSCTTHDIREGREERHFQNQWATRTPTAAARHQ